MNERDQILAEQSYNDQQAEEAYRQLVYHDSLRNTYNQPVDYEHLDDAMLAEGIALMTLDLTEIQNAKGRMEQELTRRLEERGARELAHATLIVKLEYPSPTYDVAKLRPLAEIIPPEDYAKAFQPEHTKSVPMPARFDGKQLNALARKFGQPVQEVLDQARLPSAPRLVVKAKETERKRMEEQDESTRAQV